MTHDPKIMFSYLWRLGYVWVLLYISSEFYIFHFCKFFSEFYMREKDFLPLLGGIARDAGGRVS